MALSGLVTQVMIGVSYGMTLVLIALGLSLIFGFMGTINFAHGALFMLGTYFGLAALDITGSFLVALMAAPIIVGLLALPVERLSLAPIYEIDPIYQLLSTWGVALIISEGVRLIWGLGPKRFRAPSYLDGTIALSGVSLPTYRVFVIFATFLLIGVVFLVLNRTNFGIVVRGSTYKHETMELMGVDVDRMFTAVFGIGAALAAVAGVLSAPIISVTPEMGNNWIIQAFIVVVVGGLGSLRGAVIAGLGIGVIYSLGIQFVPQFSDAIIYLIMAATLIFRPRGLLGKEGIE